jgi:tRNA threonylcarbamoyladenosine biosynthesis protein TsaB
MSLILQIDTAIKTARVCISENGLPIYELVNLHQKDHGAFIQPAIKELVKKSRISLDMLDAIAVSAGPGSYTGLRVGMASAKGLSFALNKPLITINTLNILAQAVISEPGGGGPMLFCPMIDARRMEVFTALFDLELNLLVEPVAMVLTHTSFANWLLNYKICYFGDGSYKWKTICHHPNARFGEEGNNGLGMSILAQQKFLAGDFADNAYTEPFYLKEFFTAHSTQ